jgi:hypothetical protein
VTNSLFALQSSLVVRALMRGVISTTIRPFWSMSDGEPKAATSIG